jgi:3-phosphoshikimate 1-carboxyvinyltransferase
MNKKIRTLRPGHKVEAEIRLPGSKSITHRALMMASLAQGESRIANALAAEDTLLTAEALRQLGVTINWGEEAIVVKPPEQRWQQPENPIFLGNSGTSMRLLLSLAAAGKGRFLFDGTQRLRERPVGPVLEALEALGPACRYLKQPGYPPLEIISKGLSGGATQVDARQSSQFLSSLLIAAPCARREVRIGWLEPIASLPYVTLTLEMMAQAGIHFHWRAANEIVIPAPQDYRPGFYEVEGDCSSASYFWAAAALTEGAIRTRPLSPQSRQGDLRLLEVLREMGCTVSWDGDGVTVSGPDLLQPLDLDMNAMPDMVPTVAVLAAFARGRSQIRNVAHLRVKESDRLHAIATELSRFAVPVEEYQDGLIIQGGTVHSPQGGIEVYDDHRIAMAFALMGLRIEGVEIHGAEAVAKSFPLFWELFESLARNS